MKKIKVYLSTLLVLSILLCNISVFTVNAASQTDFDGITIEFEEDVSAEDELHPMMARGCGNNLPGDFLNGGHWTYNFAYIANHLALYHGVSKEVSSANIHKIKSSYGLSGDYNCIFDYTGGVYNQQGVYLGSLITGV